MIKSQKNFTPEEITLKMCNYCAYQERSIHEVVKKLESFYISHDKKGEIINFLIDENYLNEFRFAQIYSQSKFNQLGWGKIKIRIHLKQKGVSDSDCEKVLNLITEENYLEKLRQLGEKKHNSLIKGNIFEKKQKVFNFLISKGYESYNVQNFISDIK